VLADAISLAVRDGCRGVVTVATLTGAALVALGRIHVPLMGSDEGLLQAVEHAAAASGEAVWRLPLEEEHHQLIRSKLATITNSAGPDAACITAGAFLAHFAGALPFAHCDISPASWAPGASDLGPAGATGVLVATLARLADSY
jgi:leucyl aminopeptidase